MVGVITITNLPVRKRRQRYVPKSHGYNGVELGLNPGYLILESLVKSGLLAQLKFPKQIKLPFRDFSALGSKKSQIRELGK